VDIPSPYASGPTHVVYGLENTDDAFRIIVETSHRCYDVFRVPVELLERNPDGEEMILLDLAPEELAHTHDGPPDDNRPTCPVCHYPGWQEDEAYEAQRLLDLAQWHDGGSA
jgi:hypothetical protein